MKAHQIKAAWRRWRLRWLTRSIRREIVRRWLIVPALSDDDIDSIAKQAAFAVIYVGMGRSWAIMRYVKRASKGRGGMMGVGMVEIEKLCGG